MRPAACRAGYSKMSSDRFKKNRAQVPALARALYVHVPLCRAKCHYCDFYSVPVERRLAERFVRAAVSEIARRGEELSTPLRSVFVGGGTPTCLPPDALGRLLDALRPLTDEHTEFSIEANPATLADDAADLLAGGGVNRVSIGVQSFDEAALRLLGRLHSAGQAAEACRLVREAGIGNVSLDLIYGIPGQTLRSWKDTLSAALGLGPDHLSCYALSIEPGTPLHERLRRGQIEEAEEGLQRDCYYTAVDAAEAAGLEQYEISNFARGGRRCRHNLTYWQNEPYVGIGPAAASYLAGVRRKNRPNLHAYCEALESGRPAPEEREKLTGRPAMAEALMLGLRLTEGVDRSAFKMRYGADAAEAFPQSIGRFARQGALEVTGRRIRILREFLFTSDTILAEILAES